jgi:integrase
MFHDISRMVWGRMWGKECGGRMGSLTAIKVRNLKDAGRYSDGSGLILVLNQSGKASWIVRVQNAGRRRDIGIGSYPEISLGEARETAADVRRQAKAGIDVIAERKKEKNVIPTFRGAAVRVHEEHKASWKNGKHQAQWLATLQTYVFPHIGERLVSEIEGPAIRDALAPIWLAKPETARRVRQRIGTILDWSYAKGYRTTEAPMRSIAKGLPRQPRKSGHFAAMPFEEVPAFLAKLRSRTSIGRLALEYLILNASRSGEVRGACWSEIDLKAAVWTIPAERMKINREHHVPLTPQALDVLERAQVFRCEASDLVFPGQRPKLPMSDMTLLKIVRDMDLDCTVHGFRSSFRDWVAEETDYQGEVAEAALAHTISNKVEAAYRRTDFFAKRKNLMRDWADFCLSREQRSMGRRTDPGGPQPIES